MRPLLLMLLPLLVAAGPAAPDPALQLAGRYYRQFPDAMMDGTKYRGEDIVEIVPVGPRAAYVRGHFDFANAHVCAISGIAEAAGATLVYKDAAHYGAPCVLTVSRSGKSLRFDDNGGTCSAYCGARGSLSELEVPYGSKRAITYISRLKNSREYRAAMDAWRAKTH